MNRTTTTTSDMSLHPCIETAMEYNTVFAWGRKTHNDAHAWCTTMLRKDSWRVSTDQHQSRISRCIGGGQYTYVFNCSVVAFDTQRQKTMFDLVWSERVELHNSSDAYFKWHAALLQDRAT
jgi:hypothetical protein